MKKPKRSDFERDSHGAFGEYESHMSWRDYAFALEEYNKYVEESYYEHGV